MGDRLRHVWPNPTAASVVRAREMAAAYRQEAQLQQNRADTLQAALAQVGLAPLRAADPDLAAQVAKLVGAATPDRVRALDDQFVEWGEEWHTDDYLRDPASYDDDEYVPSRVARRLSGVPEATLSQLRIAGKLTKPKYIGQPTGYVYQVGEVRNARSLLPGGGNRTPGPRPKKKTAQKKTPGKGTR